jgi:hypothetical protein
MWRSVPQYKFKLLEKCPSKQRARRKAAIWQFFLYNVTELLSKYLTSHPRNKCSSFVDYGLLACDALLFGGLLLTFQSDVLPSYHSSTMSVLISHIEAGSNLHISPL